MGPLYITYRLVWASVYHLSASVGLNTGVGSLYITYRASVGLNISPIGCGASVYRLSASVGQVRSEHITYQLWGQVRSEHITYQLWGQVRSEHITYQVQSKLEYKSLNRNPVVLNLNGLSKHTAV